MNERGAWPDCSLSGKAPRGDGGGAVRGPRMWPETYRPNLSDGGHGCSRAGDPCLSLKSVVMHKHALLLMPQICEVDDNVLLKDTVRAPTDRAVCCMLGPGLGLLTHIPPANLPRPGCQALPKICWGEMSQAFGFKEIRGPDPSSIPVWLWQNFPGTSLNLHFLIHKPHG